MGNDSQIIPITIWTGTDWIITVNFLDNSGTAINLTGYTARMVSRQTRNSSSIVIDASTTNGYIVITGSTGLITITLPNSYTSILPTPFEGDWDLFIYSASNVATRLCGGKVCIKESVTR